jgi:hypothetical protein
MLAGFAARFEEGAVHLEWTLSAIDEDAVFSVMRSSGRGSDFEEIAAVEAAAGELSYEYTDEGCRSGAAYRYRVDYRAGGEEETTLFETEEIALPLAAMTLHQNYPNPFNPDTEIRFVVPERGAVALAVYDAAGALVAVLADRVMDEGAHVVRWNGRSASGAPCASGIYFCRLQVGKETISRKMILVR